jgi:16S rRNA (cytidine1402-2'-O)-methyltransferase
MSAGLSSAGIPAGVEAGAAEPVTRRARLVLVPAPLDFGIGGDGGECADIRDLLPLGVLTRAVALTHWLVEDARTARAFLKRAAAAVGAGLDLRALAIDEMPRPAKGGGPRRLAPSAADHRRALAPLAAGHDLGLLSEAGLPGVADPGRDWVAAAHEAGFAVEILPGASSITLAVAASGLAGQSFAFVGYLPVEGDARRVKLLALEAASRQGGGCTQVFIETPYRNPSLMEALLRTLAPTTRVAVSVGLTTAGGWTLTRTVAAWRKDGTPLPDRLPAVFCLQAG